MTFLVKLGLFLVILWHFCNIRAFSCNIRIFSHNKKLSVALILSCVSAPLLICAIPMLISRGQRCADSVRTCWQPPLPLIVFHPPIRGTSLLLLPASVPPSRLYVSLWGISCLSAFYSKSNHKAFIQPKLRESGYMWPAICREMLHQRRRRRVAQSDRGREGFSDLMQTNYKM